MSDVESAQPKPNPKEQKPHMPADETFEIHAHTHRHVDGTVHNHYHSHAGGNIEHTHTTHTTHADCVDYATHLAHAAHTTHTTHTTHPVGASFLPTHEQSVKGKVMLSARDVAYSYSSSARPVFKDISFHAHAGSVLAILGNNGAGKSTLLNVLAGMVHPDAGSIYIADTKLSSLNRREIARHVAFVAQQQRIPHLRVFDEVVLGRRPHVVWSLSDYDRLVVSKAISQLGLEAFSSRYLDELSGGERQKVFIARSLAQEPEVLLLDEPTSALDPKNQLEVLHLIREITLSESITTLLVIHDINLALRFCDRFLLMRDGSIIAAGGHEVVNARTLQACYDIGFKVDTLGNIPVAVPTT